MLVLVALLSIVTLAVITLLLILRAKTRHMMQFSEKIPGPKRLPIIGNIFEVGWKPEGGYPSWSGRCDLGGGSLWAVVSWCLTACRLLKLYSYVQTANKIHTVN
jgi:uncharacterized membrane protein YedE/YeeE